MFLKKVYRHNKWIFLLMILFIIGQLFINYKRGLVISPFYHYGMYSEVIKPEASYGVYEVKVDNMQLQGKDFSPQQWDKLILPIKYFHTLDSMNGLYEKDVKRLMLSLGVRTDDSKFITPCNPDLFNEHYKGYVSNMPGRNVDSVAIHYRTYSFTGDKLKATEEVYALSQLCN